MNINTELLNFLSGAVKRPPLFEPGEAKFWDDEHISKMMLEAHLNPNHDAASRKPETIDKTVMNLFASGVLKPGMRVLDLGCGPGLYAERLCRAGVEVVGLDISERSVEYAKKHTGEWEDKIEYHCMNFFEMNYADEFDAVIQVYGELCTFSDENRDRLLGLIRRALKEEGVFIFDVSTRVQRVKNGIKNEWYVSGGGFWHPGRHLVLEQAFDYPEEGIWLSQYVVIDKRGYKIYRNWFKDYSLDSINSVLERAGFKTMHVWNDLTGCEYTEGGDWVAIAAGVRNL